MWETGKQPPKNVHIESLESVNMILLGKGVFGNVIQDLETGGGAYPGSPGGPEIQ